MLAGSESPTADWVYHLPLGLCGTDNVIGGEEVLCHCNQGIPWPTAEPVHSTATDEPRELEGTVAELLTNLSVGKDK